MDYRLNEFKKYLIDEVKSKSFQNYPEIVKEVELFSSTAEFQEAYKKWKSLKPKHVRKGYGPKHIMG